MLQMLLSETLQKARGHVENNASSIGKPLFHVSCPIGWMNDPNGLSVYDGEVHLFYQHYPYAPHWGDMHWGHCKTSNMLDWTHLPVALAPDTPYDKGGCFSGSAIQVDDRHVLMYTGIARDAAYPYEQNQCIAYGDGIEYTKPYAKPVILASSLPDFCGKADFRDPKLWREDGVYYAAVGSKDISDIGQVVLFRSHDLENWSFVSVLAKGRPGMGQLWECPDLFTLDDRHVLLVSPQFMEASGQEFHCGNGTLALVGTLDPEAYELAQDTEQAIDYGLDFYAPQTVLLPDGRRIMMGWLQSWDNNLTPPDQNWSGVMSIPRELSIRNGRLCQTPISELATRRSAHVAHDVTLSGESIELHGVSGRSFDMELALDMASGEAFEIRLASSERHHTSFIIDPKKGLITFDRSYSGIYRDIVCTRCMAVPMDSGKLNLRLIMDVSSIELFADGGAYAFSALISTEHAARNILFTSKGQTKLVVDFYSLEKESAE